MSSRLFVMLIATPSSLFDISPFSFGRIPVLEVSVTVFLAFFVSEYEVPVGVGATVMAVNDVVPYYNTP
jgi:hypothetical protein